MSGPTISCTLDRADLERVRARYAAAAEHYEGSVRFEGATARVALRGDRAEIGALLDEMIARERACCPFLQFDPEERDDGYNLRLSINGAPGMEREVLKEMIKTLFPAAELTG